MIVDQCSGVGPGILQIGAEVLAEVSHRTFITTHSESFITTNKSPS